MRFEITAKRQLNGSSWRDENEITVKRQLNGPNRRDDVEITAKRQLNDSSRRDKVEITAQKQLIAPVSAKWQICPSSKCRAGIKPCVTNILR